MSLLLTIILTLAAVSLANWLSGSDLFRQFFFPKVCDKSFPATCDPLDWKDLFQAAILVLGLPVAFLLWHWRDVNVRDQIEEQRKQVENSRRDINLKEFQDVQMRAAGALDEKLPADARHALQIAALHQLTGFLQGEYGDVFRRPALEILLAGHAIAMKEIGVHTVSELIDQKEVDVPIFIEIFDTIEKMRNQLTYIMKIRMHIIENEWENIYDSKFPMNERSFDFLDLRHKNLSGIQAVNSSFIGAHLNGADFSNANLWLTNMIGASLTGVNFKLAKLTFARLDCAQVENTEFDDAYCIGTRTRDCYPPLDNLQTNLS
jgi:Pentapeptide repeats (8 copies)